MTPVFPVWFPGRARRPCHERSGAQIGFKGQVSGTFAATKKVNTTKLSNKFNKSPT